MFLAATIAAVVLDSQGSLASLVNLTGNVSSCLKNLAQNKSVSQMKGVAEVQVGGQAES